MLVQGSAAASNASVQDQSGNGTAAFQAAYPARAPLVYLPTTFDSFMAGSYGVSSLPQLSPRKDAEAVDHVSLLVNILGSRCVLEYVLAASGCAVTSFAVYVQ